MDLSFAFADSYAQARREFLAAARALDAQIESHRHPSQRGVAGEELAMDIARLGSSNARALLILSSGTHGAEGYCGSGCQVALMNDTELLVRLDKHNTALLLIHAVNPYGFSHVRRTNEDNIDLNRSFIDFSRPLPRNDSYGEVHDLLLPAQWPPTAQNEAAIQAFIAQKSELYFRDAVSMGQTTHSNGLFYRGTAASWSNQTLRKVVRGHGAGAAQIAWIDLHSGLGPKGHGEKIFAGHDERFTNNHDPLELVRAQAIWGADVVSIFSNQSVSRNSRGGAITCLVHECPQATSTTIGLEFGTLDRETVMLALRAEQWLANNPQASAAQRLQIKRELRNAFYVDTPEWRGMVYSQTRVMVLQSILGMAQVLGQ